MLIGTDQTTLHAFFAPAVCQKRTFDNPQQLDRQGLIDRIFSSSYMPLPGSPRHAELPQAINAVFYAHQENGVVTMPHDTEVFFGQLRPDPAAPVRNPHLALPWLTCSRSVTERRYLVPFKAARLPQHFTDVLVIGGGDAGLRSAIAAADAGTDVLILTKDTVDESNTWYAQGGIAAVLQPLDSIESHVNDTEVGGAGLCDDAIVRIVIEEGPKRVLELLEWGANFDKKIGNPYDLGYAAKAATVFAPHRSCLRRRHGERIGANTDSHRARPRKHPHRRANS